MYIISHGVFHFFSCRNTLYLRELTMVATSVETIKLHRQVVSK